MAKLVFKIIKNEKGQGATEYILLVAFAVMAFLALSRGIAAIGLQDKLMASFTKDFKYAYQYGHVEARGYGDPQGPKMHPRITEGENFRIFLNPHKR